MIVWLLLVACRHGAEPTPEPKPDIAPPTPVCESAVPDAGCWRRLGGGPTPTPSGVVEVAPFWIHALEVDAAAFDRCVTRGACDAGDALAAGGYATAGTGRASLPVVGLSRPGADRLCAHLGGRLPTDAEWTHAAAGTEGRRFPWGRAVRCPTRTADDGVTADALKTACGPVYATVGPALPDGRWDALWNELTGALPPAHLADLCRTHADADAPTALAALRAAVDAGADQPLECTRPRPVPTADLLDATPDGVLGLASNLSEWVAGDDDTTGRVRGASMFHATVASMEATFAQPAPVTAHLPDVGVRCARDAR